MTDSQEAIWLVEELWQDAMENSAPLAMGYRPIGYVTDSIVSDYRDIVVSANGWPLITDTPRYRLTLLHHAPPPK